MTSNEYKPKNDGWDFEGTHNEDAEGWDVPVEKKKPEIVPEPVVFVEEPKEELKEEPAEEIAEPVVFVEEPIEELKEEPSKKIEEPVAVVEDDEPETVEIKESAEIEEVETIPEPVVFVEEPKEEHVKEIAEPAIVVCAPATASVPENVPAAEPKKAEVKEEIPEPTEEDEIEEILAPEPEVHHSNGSHITVPAPVRDASGERLYKRPSTMSQIITIYMLQMKLYSKNKMTYIMFLLVALIPAIVYSGYAEQAVKLFTDMFMGISLLSTTPAYLLIMLPFFIVAIPAILCGRSMSSEFKNRTVYLNLPLPMARSTFFLGKFLAGVTLVVILIFAALVLGIYLGDEATNSDVASAMIVCISGAFAMAATAYGLGPLFKRGSTAFTLVLMIILPLILPMIFMMLTDGGQMSEELAEDLMKYVTLLPIYAPFQTLWLLDNNFGGDAKELVSLLSGSEFGPFVYLIAAVVWSAVFIMIGLQRVKSKEL